MNSIRRITPTNLLPPQLSKQDSPFPRNRARALPAWLAGWLPAYRQHPLSRLHTREGGRYSSESNYPTGASGFWYRRLQSIRRSGHPPPVPPYALFHPHSFSSPTRTAAEREPLNSPRYALVRERPPVKMRETRHRRILDSAIPRRVARRPVSVQQLSASPLRWDSEVTSVA